MIRINQIKLPVTHDTVQLEQKIKKALKLKDKADISVDLKQIGLHGKVKVRDLWRHKDIGVFKGYFTQEINQHGAGLYRISPVK